MSIVDPGLPSTAFTNINAALVFLMIPGLGFFYSGLTRKNNALSLILICLLSSSIVTIQWMLFGFSLSFSESSGSTFIGNFEHGGFTNVGKNILALTAPAIPSLTLALYQLQFAAITPAIIFGSVAERFRFLPAMLFVLLWTTFVYDFIAYWTFSARGWMKNMTCISKAASDIPCALGALDFAGGGAVHIASGFAGLAYCIMLGKRKATKVTGPHNMTYVFLGTALLWYGWFGFNGGSSLSSTSRASMAAFVTTLSASCGGLAWTFLDYFKHRKVSGLAFCSGAVAGLVVITPAAGYVAPWASIIIGLFAGIGCNLGCRFKQLFGFDDSLDAFGIHGVGGVLGCVMTGVFAQGYIGHLDDAIFSVGWIDGNFIQVPYQIAAACAAAAWSFVISIILLYSINKIPGLHLRHSKELEYDGADKTEMGETAYDYIRRSNFKVNDSSQAVNIQIQ